MVLRSAAEQKKAEEEKEFGAIDYDAPVETEKAAIGLGTKVRLKSYLCFFMWINASFTVLITKSGLTWNRLEWV